MNCVNVLKQNKTKQKYQKFRFKILRYCENKMLNENLAHKNGLLHVYMYMIYILMNLIGYIGLLDIPVHCILICTLVYISVIILFLKCLCYTSVCI